jgi:hypothetical protein
VLFGASLADLVGDGSSCREPFVRCFLKASLFFKGPVHDATRSRIHDGADSDAGDTGAAGLTTWLLLTAAMTAVSAFNAADLTPLLTAAVSAFYNALSFQSISLASGRAEGA